VLESDVGDWVSIWRSERTFHVPTAPDPPVLFNTVDGTPSSFESIPAMNRRRVIGPPLQTWTVIVIGFVGYAGLCKCREPATNDKMTPEV
jgi:hypothetical protein